MVYLKQSRDCGTQTRRTLSSHNLLMSRTCYIGIALYVVGFVLLGVSLQDRLPIPVIVVGWAIAQIAVLVTTVAVCELMRLGTC